jgi:hypothetical protein
MSLTSFLEEAQFRRVPRGTAPVDVILGVDVFDTQEAVIDYGSASLFLREPT